jgi:hypothetical protein
LAEELRGVLNTIETIATGGIVEDDELAAFITEIEEERS